jgi:uncharacterized repeat protein (TIGR01451 family)
MSNGISVDSAGNACVTGPTTDSTFPVVNPVQAFGRTGGAFAAELNKTASQLLFSAALGCCGDTGNGIHADNYGNLALTQAELAVTNSAPRTILTGTHLTYTITVTNNGPDTADQVTLTDSVPRGTTFVSAATNAGSCKTPAVGAASGKVTCAVSSLANGVAFTISMVVDATYKSGKTLTDTASVSSLVFDANLTNNSATASTRVN